MKNIILPSLIICILINFVCMAGTANSQSAEFNMLFLGASITSGFGLENDRSFPIQFRQIAAKHSVNVKIFNSASPGASSREGLSQFEKHSEQQVDYLIVGLGLSDVIYGYSPSDIKHNLDQLIKSVRSSYHKVKICLYQGIIFQRHVVPNLPNAKSSYETAYLQLFKDVAIENRIQLLPPMVEGLIQNEHFQADQIHPNSAGAQLIARNLWDQLSPQFSAD